MFSNPAMDRMLGYDAGELKGRKVWSLEAGDPEPLRATIRGLVRDQPQPEPYQGTWATKGGRPLHVQVDWNYRRDENGNLVGLVSAVTDVTERRQEEQQSREVALRYETILKEIPDIIMEVDANRVYTWANPAGYAFFGKDVIGKEAATYFEGDQDTYDYVKPLFSGDSEVFYVESWQRRQDGERRLLAWWCQALKDQDGRVVGALSTARDITDRRRAEQALRESEERFHLAVQGANDGLWDWPDIQQDAQWWSPRFYELIGYRPDEIEAKNSVFNSLVHPEDLARVLAASRADSVGQPFEVEYRLRVRSGEYRWFSTRGAIVRSPEGVPVRMSGSLRDITDRRKAVSERMAYQAKLKSLTSQVALAEERERRRIAVGVHDDIGQRLVLAKLELQSIRRAASHPDLAQGIDRVCALIDQTLQEARSLAFDLSNPVLYEVGFDAAVESWLNRQIEQRAGIRCDFASDLAGAKLDETMAVALFQAVREVLTNVVKHSKAKAMKVRIQRAKGEVCVTVEDDGVGFDPAILDWSAESQRGLGLFNVKERIEYLKGRLEIHSAPGQGTTVILAVPFKAADGPVLRPGGKVQDARARGADRTCTAPPR